MNLMFLFDRSCVMSGSDFFYAWGLFFYMKKQQDNNPLHGITLEQIVESLVDHYGWAALGQQINIRCFNSDPSIKSSLKFLRKTPWARSKVEQLFLAIQNSPWNNSL